MIHSRSHPLDTFIDPSLPFEEKEVLTDFLIELGFPLPQKFESLPDFGYVVEDGHITQIGLCFRVAYPNSDFISIIKNIPKSIGQLTYLKYLNLRGNSIRYLPPQFMLLRNLETLDLEENPIQELPFFLRNLKNLRHLYMKKTGVIITQEKKNCYLSIEHFDVETVI
jgi:hypothetical protein